MNQATEKPFFTPPSGAVDVEIFVRPFTKDGAKVYELGLRYNVFRDGDLWPHRQGAPHTYRNQQVFNIAKDQAALLKVPCVVLGAGVAEAGE